MLEQARARGVGVSVIAPATRSLCARGRHWGRRGSSTVMKPVRQFGACWQQTTSRWSPVHPNEVRPACADQVQSRQFLDLRGTRAVSIYVYTFHAIILPAGRGEAQVQAYSQDLRERVLRALDRGDRPTEIARRFEVSRIGVYQVRGREQETGVRTSLPIGGHRRSRLVEMEPVLRAWIAAQPDLTLAELQERLAQQGVAIKIGALWHQLN